MEENVDPTKYLVEMLDFYKQKLLGGGCTMAEIRSMTDAMMERMEIDGTIQDFAKFFGVPEVNIRAAISRRLIAKPKRKLLYPFHKFFKVAPDKWKKRL